jgi:hypothetical protein
MQFQPSDYSEADYGESSSFPVSSLTRPTASGVPNVPRTVTERENLDQLSDFLARIPFNVTINSGFRSPEGNRAVGGSSSSDHAHGLAADLQPADARLGTYRANKALAEWFYQHRASFPELDQVIWYEDKSHTHVGISPTGVGRQQFKRHTAMGNYPMWVPTPAEAARWASTHPGTVGIGIGLYVVGSLAVSSVVIALAWRWAQKNK